MDRNHHPSRLQLDLRLADVAPESLAPHLADCNHCQERLERMSADYAAFVERFATADSLRRPGRAAPDAPESASGTPTPRRRLRALVSAAAATAAVAAALVVGLIWILPSADSPLSFSSTSSKRTTSTERTKGGSIVEIAVKRAGESTPYEGQTLWSGDVLAFRVTTKRRYLLLLSVEQTGRINVFLTDPHGKQSLAITPGIPQVLPHGVELDDYVGLERLIALLTDRPLSVAAVRRELQRRYRALTSAKRRTLELSLPRYDGDTLTWLLTKVAP